MYLQLHTSTHTLSLLCWTQSHALSLSPTHPHAQTHSNLCSIDSITSLLHTVIWLRNCLQSVSPGNSWASSALFWTPNKDPFLIGPSRPLSLFLLQSDFVFTGGHSSSEWVVKGWGERNLHWHLRSPCLIRSSNFRKIDYNLEKKVFKKKEQPRCPDIMGVISLSVSIAVSLFCCVTGYGEDNGVKWGFVSLVQRKSPK